MKALRKSIFLLAVLLILAAVIPVSAAETVESGTCGTGLTWTLDSDGVLTVTGEGGMEDYSRKNSPAPWADKNVTKAVICEGVTEIGDYAFYGCTGLISVTIPDSVTDIGSYAFYGCSRLTSVTIPNSVTEIGSSAFDGCTGLTSITIPNSVTEIGSSAFEDCTGLTSITIPNSVTEIGSSAFEGCTGLTSVTIQEGVTGIGYAAFKDCTGLTSLTIPASVKSIGGKIFSRCVSLKAIAVNADNANYSSVDGVLYNKKQTKIICCPTAKTGSVEIPEGMTFIDDYTFSGCTGLTSITIPNSVTGIGYAAFEDCTGLTSLTIPASVKSIGGEIFSRCVSLKAITVNADNANYSSVDGVLYNKKQTEIICCPTAKTGSVEIPEGMTFIDDYTFYGCTGLTSITIPNSVTSIGEYAFYGCAGLTSFTIPEGVTSINNCVFYGCTGLTSLAIPSNVAYIGRTAFGGCTGLTSIAIPSSVTYIGEYAFYGCSALTSIAIPEGVTNIAESIFSGCTNLTSVKIPASVTTIEKDAFLDCSNLENVTVDQNNSIYMSVDGILYSKEPVKMLLLPKAISGQMRIPEGITSIDSLAFADYTGLTSVTIPSSVTSIGYAAFRDCTGLNSLVISEGVTDIGRYAFSGCTNLTSVSIPSSVTSIGYAAFRDCTGLNSLVISEGVTDIGQYVFSGCTGLTSVNIPSSVTFIDGNPFYGCTSLTEITVDENNANYSSVDGILYNKDQTEVICCPGKKTGPVTIPMCVTDIAYGAFADCTILSSIEIPDSVVSIGSDAFRRCGSLTSVTIPKKASRIGDGAFADTALKTVVFEGDIRSWFFEGSVFRGVTATAYYPKNNGTWTDEVRDALGRNATLTWKSYTPGKIPGESTLEIEIQPQTQYVQLGEKAKFTVKAEGDGLTYQWYYKDVDGTKYKKCSGTKSSYSIEMTEARKDRKFYCIVKDEYGNEVKTKTVYMRMAASIKTEPKTQYVQLDEKAKFTVKAVGDDLKYQWYYKSAGSSKYKKADCTKSSYSITMTEDRKDRKFYCVVTDKKGNEVKSKTVTMKLAASIKTEPKSVKTSIGKKAKFTVKAVGDGLKYQWYYKDTDGKKYKKASCTKATYSIELTKARNGRKFYCVITDKYGNEVKTKTVSMKKK